RAPAWNSVSVHSPTREQRGSLASASGYSLLPQLHRRHDMQVESAFAAGAVGGEIELRAIVAQGRRHIAFRRVRIIQSQNRLRARPTWAIERGPENSPAPVRQRPLQVHRLAVRG